MTTDIQSVDYHQLTVAAVEPLTDDSVAITFDVPDSLAGTFGFIPGQHVALKADINGADTRRTYSVCAAPEENRLRIGVKRIQGGAFSTYATRELRVGDQIEVAAPHGEFTIAPDASTTSHYGAIVAGSGITPVLSMISAVLATEPNSKFTLIYGNRSAASIMFLDEIEGLKDRFPGRFHLINVLSQEAQIIPLLSGRLDEQRLAEIFGSIVDVGSVSNWYLCGPFEVVEAARAALHNAGVAAAAVHDELFFAQPAPAPAPSPPEKSEGLTTVQFTLDGRTSSVAVDPDGPPILAYALDERRDTPFSCRGGMCTTCKAQVIEGEARMDLNFALAQEDLAKGYILTCQAHPTSATLAITYDV